MNRFLDDFCTYIKENRLPVFNVATAVKGGEVEVRELQATNPCQNTYSISKAFVVTAIGLLWDHGMIDLSDRVLDLLGSEVSAATRKKMDPRWRDVTVEMALLHQLALPEGFLDIDVPHADFGEDYLAYMLSYKAVGEFGGKRTYTDGAYYLLARVVEKLTGMRLDAFLWQHIFAPFGVREVAWSCCPMGHTMGATGLYLHARDVVKLGILYRDGGVYEGQRLLSREFVDMVLQRGFELRVRAGGVAWGKSGSCGQMLAVFPKTSRVLAFLGYGDYDRDALLAAAAALDT